MELMIETPQKKTKYITIKSDATNLFNCLDEKHTDSRCMHSLAYHIRAYPLYPAIIIAISISFSMSATCPPDGKHLRVSPEGTHRPFAASRPRLSALETPCTHGQNTRAWLDGRFIFFTD